MKRVSVAVAVLLLALGACKSSDAKFRPLAAGEPVPAFTVRTLAGDSASVGHGEQLTLLNLWATWCGPCQEEFPELEQLHRDYQAKGLRILAVSVDMGNDANVREFAEAHGATFTIGRDGEGRMQRLYQTVGLPETFLIAPDGTLLWRHFGALKPGAVDLRRRIDQALGAGEGASRAISSRS
ncbi:MAG TPA: TlpA disulfide reductase family protein [Gemmatimonadaceae bacterium]|nr:TlpA disulfide reductase family protein [Gemmatimonadaceae bacterium]